MGIETRLLTLYEIIQKLSCSFCVYRRGIGTALRVSAKRRLRQRQSLQRGCHIAPLGEPPHASGAGTPKGALAHRAPIGRLITTIILMTFNPNSALLPTCELLQQVAVRLIPHNQK